jgi:hypothetical protein
MATPKVKTVTAEVRLKKNGPNGIPLAEVLVGNGVSATQLSAIVQRFTRDKDLLRKLGLKACPACKSGFDIDIRERFEHVLQVEVQ